jgi:hypothetical protein
MYEIPKIQITRTLPPSGTPRVTALGSIISITKEGFSDETEGEERKKSM